MNALEKAISIAGSQSELARRSGVKQQNIWYWLNEAGGRVPAEKVSDLCKAVDNEVTPNDFRPDIFPPSEPLSVLAG